MIYTVPLSLVYSYKGSSRLREVYGWDRQVLPMLMICQRDGKIDAAGRAKVEELIQQRIHAVAPTLNLVPDVFDTPDTLTHLCLMSGGHMRELMQLMQAALNEIDSLPITTYAARRTIGRARNSYASVDEGDWDKLVKVFKEKRLLNEDAYRDLLSHRYIFEYRYIDEHQDSIIWHDVHPLIQGLEEFRKRLLQESS